MSKEWVYKVSQSVVFFTASTLFPWHFGHLSPLHNKDFERAERIFNYKKPTWEPFPAWNEAPSGVCSIPSAGRMMWRMGEGRVPQGPAAPWEGVPGRCFLGCLCIPEFSPKPSVSPWGSSCSGFSWGTIPKVPVRLQFLSLHAAVWAQEMIPSIPRNDLHSPVLHHEKGNSRSTVQVPAECKAIQ